MPVPKGHLAAVSAEADGPAWLPRQLLRARWAHFADHAFLARSEPHVVGPRLAQTQRPVRAAAALVRFSVILPVVLPIADLADLESRSLCERLAPATRAPER